MMPLWMMARLWFSEQWGWALTSLGSPWVAQRVCAMPSLVDRELGAVVDQGDARAVIASVFEPLEALDQYEIGLAAANIPSNPTHY